MNRFINALLLFIFLPTLLLTIYIGFDLPINILRTTGANLPYGQEIELGLGTLILIIGIRRSIRRWMGMRIVSKKEKFLWNAEVSLARKKRVNTYLLLESTIMTAIAAGLYLVSPAAWMPSLALVIIAIDGIIFAIIGSNGRYRVALSSKALIIADREVIVLYFKGLRKVSAHQQTVYFDYIKGLQLSFPTNCLDEKTKTEFLKQLESQLDPNKVFFSKQL